MTRQTAIPTDSKVENQKKVKPKLSMAAYIKSCGGKDIHHFETMDEAYNFGVKIREANPEIEVDISNTIVRLTLKPL